MDLLSSAASVVAVIQLTGSLVKICGGYIQEVNNARDEIIKLQRGLRASKEFSKTSISYFKATTTPYLLPRV